MSRIERSVLIDRSVPEVFAYMDDVDREREWQPNLLAASQDPPGPVGVGTVKRYRMRFLKREIENVYRVVEYEMYVRTRYVSTPESAVQATAEITWAQEGQATRVTMAIDATPGKVLKLVPKPVLESASMRELERMLDGLRARLETT